MEVANTPLDICACGYNWLGEGETKFFCITVMCNRVRFYINLSSKNLGEPGSNERSELAKTFRKLKKRLPGPDEVDDDAPPNKAETKFTAWVMNACASLMREISTEHSITKYETLDQYIHPHTYVLKIINKDGRLSAERSSFDPTIMTELDRISRIPISDLPDCKYAFVAAHAVQLVENSGRFHHVAAEKVKLASGCEYFFKPPCLREIQTHIRIQASQKLPENLRITHIQGLVEAYDDINEAGTEYQNNRYVVGVLLNLIDVKHTLLAAEAENTVFSIDDRVKWFKQIQYIISKLHEAGIYWGDVQPGNVVVDQNNDAWVVDMAGGFTSGWGVTEEDYDTERGDFRGLEYLAIFMGLVDE